LALKEYRADDLQPGRGLRYPSQGGVATVERQSQCGQWLPLQQLGQP